jgi:hypothetical protein
VLDTLLRLGAGLGPLAAWCFLFVAVIAAVFVLYVGIALWAVLSADSEEQRTIRYQVFKDLLDVFRRRKRS